MAGGAVRELITKVKFIVDNSSLSKINTEIRKLKNSLRGISSTAKSIKINTTGVNASINNINRLNQKLAALRNKTIKIKVSVNTSSINSAIAQIRSQMAHLNLQIHANASLMTIRATTVNLYGRINHNGGGGGNSGRNGAPGGNDIGGAIMGAAGAYGGYLGVSEITDTADAMMNLDGRLRTVTKDAQERLAIENQLYAMGQKTRQSLEPLGDLYFKVARASEEMGFSQQENLRVTETVSKALVVGGASAAEASATILQLGQALGSGRLQGDELRSLDENASALMRHVAKYFGTTVAGLKEMGAAGELTSDEVMKALLSASEAIDDEFMQMPMTFGQSMNVMRNSWSKFILGVEQKSNVFSMVARGATKAFESIGDQFNNLLTLLGTPDPNKMVTITDEKTGEQKQISEVEYYTKVSAENPGLTETIKTLKQVGEWLDELDGKTGNIDEQIARFIEMFLKIGAIVAPIIAIISAISGLSFVFAPLIEIISTVATAIGAVASIGFGPLLLIIGAVAAVIYTLQENWDTVVALFRPGLQAMESGLESLRQAWENIQPFITALMPLIKVVAQLIGGAIVANVLAMWNLFTAAFNAIAGLIEWVSGLLGGLGSTIQSIGDALGGLISKAKEFLGMGDAISGMNSNVAQRIWERGTGQSSVSQSQNNTYNLPSMDALPAAQNASNSWFGQTDWAYQ